MAPEMRLLVIVLTRLTLVLALIGAAAVAVSPGNADAFRSHSHNDYLQPEPLATALAQRMGSVEADIWLIDGELRVGHTREETRPGRTLRALYLEPLRRVVGAADGRVYPEGPPLQLLIDIKGEPEATYAALVPELAAYASLFTEFDGGRVRPRAVTVVLSGNTPRARLAAEDRRLAACDGRPADLAQNPPVGLVPLISDNWTKHFRWDGRGVMPPVERDALHRLAAHCHAQGRTLRLWAAPDTEACWREQFEAGVDYLNTDRPAALRAFLRRASGGAGVEPRAIRE